MPLHRLASITIGVPNVEATCRYYAEFGLTRDGTSFSTSDGGAQLCIVESPSRRLIELSVGVDDPDDLDRVSGELDRLEIVSCAMPTVSVRKRSTVASMPSSGSFPGSLGVRHARFETVTRACSSGQITAHRPSIARNRFDRTSWGMWWSGPPMQVPPSNSSPKGSDSRSVMWFAILPHS